MFDNVGKTHVGIAATSDSLNVKLWLPDPIANGEITTRQQMDAAIAFANFLNARQEKGVTDWGPLLVLRNF